MTSTMRAPTVPTSGRREAVPSILHDIDDRSHQLAVDFPITLDSYRTDFGPGAFQEGWDRQLPVMVTNHDQSSVIGRAIRAESLPNAHRLVGKFANFDEVPAARVAFSLIRDQIYPGFSFFFIGGVPVPHPSGVRSAIRYQKAKMVEYGPVLAPSIPGTVVVPGSLRSAQHGGRSNVADQLRRDFARIDLDRIDQVQLEQVRRTGQLPRSVASRVHDAGTRQCEADIEQLAELGEALLHAEQTRADLRRRGL